MFFTEEKLNKRIQALQPLRYRNSVQITSFECQLDTAGSNGASPPAAGPWTTMQHGDEWTGTDTYLWLKTEITVPSEWQDRTIVGRFNFGTTGSGNNSGFESLLYVNGSIYQGVDSNHEEVFFDSSYAGQTVQLVFRLWSGLAGMQGYHQPQTHRLAMAELVWLDPATDDLYYTSRTALDTVQQLAEDSPVRTQLLSALDAAWRLVDWRIPASDAFYISTAAANDALQNRIHARDKQHAVTIHGLGHTHIDVAWLWRLRHTREKAARSFATVMRLMDRYPEFIFMQTQPQLYDYVKHDYPELYAQIKERVKQGRWEADGGMWLEADCNLTSGESLVRQILFGSRFLKKELGVDCEYLWLPDVFGYSWALPQILKKSGLRTFMTTKISWNQYNRMPHDTFWWRGIDGSEMLTHFITTPPDWAAPNDWRYVYEGDITPKTVLGSWTAYRDKGINQELLISYGFGDGGGGVNRDMIESMRRIQTMPGLPHVVPNTARSFFRKLHEQVAATDGYVHTWDGELYLEYHRGTYTSQAYNKKMNRQLELLYRRAEWLASFASAAAGSWSSYPQAQLHDGWKIILRNQFHDIIPGSSIAEVYEDSRTEYAEAEAIGQSVVDAAMEQLQSANPDGTHAWTIWNSAPWPMNDLVQIPDTSLSASGTWLESGGKPLPAVYVDGRWTVEVHDVPAMGAATIQFTPGSETAAVEKTAFEIGEQSIVTPFYRIAWNADGQLTELYDLACHREVLAEGARGNILQVFEDKPLRFDAWDIDLFYQQKSWTMDACTIAEVVEVSPLRAVVRFAWTYQNSRIEQDMVVYANKPRIDFMTNVDWHEHQQLLKVAFPVQIRATEATYDIQFGNVKRPTHWNTSWDAARFETVGHQWADLSERDYGVSLLNDCKYGYDIHDNVLRLSLIKSAIEPDRSADQGHHSFTYALLPHSGDWLEAKTVQSAFALNAPLTASKGSLPADVPASLLTVSSNRVMVDAVKQSEDGDSLVVRLHDFSGGRQRVQLQFGCNVSAWQRCNLMELPEGERIAGDAIVLELGPYEIETILVELG